MTADRKKAAAERRRAWRIANPEKVRAYEKTYRERNREGIVKAARKWRAANKEKHATIKRKCNLRQLGLTVAAYNEMLAAQGGVCAICKQPETHQRDKLYTLSVDHCHATGRVRGLLCNLCNRAIGLLRDSADLCAKAAEYLK
jgi:ferric-dicitrate binding protein FerR (iron transport regulator)